MFVAALTLFSGAAVLSPALRLAALALDLALVVALALDFVTTPRPDRLDVRRRAPARVGQGQSFERVVRVDAASVPRAAGLRIEVDEEFPPSFEVRARSALDASDPGRVAPAPDDPSGGPDTARVPAAGVLDLRRTYRAGLRGVHALGDLRVRLTGRLGLVVRSARIAGGTPIAVEPALLALSQNLRLAARERWRELGAHVSRQRGGLQEFEGLRDHVTGDDVRRVDWKAFARRGRPIVREYREERGQELLIAIDCGRRMAATTSEEVPGRGGRAVARGMTKLDHALDAALQLAAVALEHGDRVGALAFDSGVRAWIPARRGRAQLARLRESLFALEPAARESDLERALRELSLRHRRRALVLVLSDVSDPLSLDRQRRALHAGRGRQRVIFAGLDDPAVRAVAERRLAADPALVASALAQCAERKASLARLAGGGVRVIDALPAEAAAPAIAAWLDARRAG